MSGNLSSFSAFVGRASAIGSAVSQLFGGSGGVTLGSVTFAGTEVPETIKWGGKQDIIKHRLPGGKVIMSAMGVDFEPISWSGIFEGFSAISRSRQLYAMCAAAAPVSLTWNDRSYTVMVESYEAEDTKTNWIPYRVTVCVLRDETLSGTASSPSLLSQITSDLAGAIGITPAALTAGVGTALSVAQTASTVVGAVTAGGGAALALTGALGGAQAAVGGAMAIANSAIGGIVANAVSTGAAVLPLGSAAAGVANMATALTSAQNLAALPIIGGLVGRAQTNLANAST